MNRFICALLAFCVALSLCSCSSQKPAQETSEPSVGASEIASYISEHAPDDLLRDVSAHVDGDTFSVTATLWYSGGAFFGADTAAALALAEDAAAEFCLSLSGFTSFATLNDLSGSTASSVTWRSTDGGETGFYTRSDRGEEIVLRSATLDDIAAYDGLG